LWSYFVDSYLHAYLLKAKSPILSDFDHVMRKEGDSLEKEIMQGTVPGARKQGRPKMKWIDDMENGLRCRLKNH